MRETYTILKKPVPFDTLHIDHFGPLPQTKSKKKYILVAYTKFTKLYAVNSTGSREACNV